VGGVINIITRQTGEFEAEIQAGYGSYDRQFQVLKLANQFGNGTGMRLTAERRLADNYRDNNNLDYTNGLFKVSYDWDRGNVFVTLQRTDEEIGIPGDLLISQLNVSRTQSDTPLDFNDTVSEVFQGGGSFSITPAWDAAAEFTHRDEDVKAVVTLGGVPFILTQKRLHKSFNPRLRGRLSFGGQGLFLTTGADIEKTDYSLISLFGATNSTQDVCGLYALGIMPVDNVITMTGGIRRTWVENDIVDGFAAPDGTLLEDNQTVSSLGLIIRPLENIRMFLKREDNFRFPLIDEQTSVIGFQAPLETQTGVSYETGIEWDYGRISTKLIAYRLKLENEIIFDPGTFTNINLDPTTRTGAILEAGVSLSNDIFIDAQYTYTDARFDAGQFTGNRIPLVSEHQLHVGLHYSFAPDWSFYGETLFMSDKVAGNDFADQFPDVPGYATGNIHLRFDNGRYNFSAGVNNLLDAQYRESAAVNFLGQTGYFPAPERNFMITVGYSF
jgi:Outer membrane receptor proteins, mostly Fe transport